MYYNLLQNWQKPFIVVYSGIINAYNLFPQQVGNENSISLLLYNAPVGSFIGFNIVLAFCVCWS